MKKIIFLLILLFCVSCSIERINLHYVNPLATNEGYYAQVDAIRNRKKEHREYKKVERKRLKMVNKKYKKGHI
jgi:hypothetical protein